MKIIFVYHERMCFDVTALFSRICHSSSARLLPQGRKNSVGINYVGGDLQSSTLHLKFLLFYSINLMAFCNID